MLLNAIRGVSVNGGNAGGPVLYRSDIAPPPQVPSVVLVAVVNIEGKYISVTYSEIIALISVDIASHLQERS